MIKPLGNRILIAKGNTEPEKLKSGILIPETSVKEKNTAEVLAVGDDAKYIKKGDTIIKGMYGGVEVKHEEKTYLLIKEDEILGKIV